MNKTSNVNHPQYTEAAALSALLSATDEAVNEMNDDYEKSGNIDHMSEQLLITVGGKTIALLLGGPQVSGLDALVEHIADENGYTIDRSKATVID